MGACRSLEPDYPVVAVEYDEGLIGTWVVGSGGSAKEQAPEGGRQARLIVSPRVVPVRGGRLNPDEPMIVECGEVTREAT